MQLSHEYRLNTFVSKNIKSPTESRKRARIPVIEYPAPSSYIATLLREYKILVELMTHLDESSFQNISPEVNVIIGELKQWLDQSSSKNTLDVYWNMRQLRQKIHGWIKQTNYNSQFRNCSYMPTRVN